ncbi:MAG TPA: T9SS type A sorting domain-containing protein, partial [Saprospiraceae bacterium]|nr:T9SS type A sorting domain-containing protein [Saprospiraceae bacterium]
VNVLAAGAYSVTATDANGCESTVAVEIAEPPALMVAISQENDTLSVAELNAAYQWIDCDTGAALPGENGPSLIANLSGAYAVIVIDSTGVCRDTSDCIAVFINAAGETDRPTRQAIVFPNPNNGRFTLNLPWKAEGFFYDAFGNLVQKEAFDSGEHSVILEQLPAGFYLLMLRSREGIQTIHLIRQ